MQVPTSDKLINPTLQAIRALGGSASNAEIVKRVVENLQLPEDVVEQPHGTGGMTELEYQLTWARSALKM